MGIFKLCFPLNMMLCGKILCRALRVLRLATSASTAYRTSLLLDMPTLSFQLLYSSCKAIKSLPITCCIVIDTRDNIYCRCSAADTCSTKLVISGRHAVVSLLHFIIYLFHLFYHKQQLSFPNTAFWGLFSCLQMLMITGRSLVIGCGAYF